MTHSAAPVPSKVPREPTGPDDPVYDLGQAAELLGVPRRWLIESLRTGDVPCVRFSARNVRFTPANIQTIIAAHTTSSPPRRAPLPVPRTGSATKRSLKRFAAEDTDARSA